MTNTEFIKEIESNLLNLGYRERKDIESRKNINWYYQTYSAMNMMVDSEYYDVEGGQIWITIPCKVEGYENFFFQLNLRNFDLIKFKCNPDIALESIVPMVFFIYDWNNLGVYDYKSKCCQLSPKNQKIGKRYINPLFGHNNHWYHYKPDNLLIENMLLGWIPLLDDFLNKNFIKIAEALAEIKKTKSKTKRNKIYSQNIKPLLKECIGDSFSIR